jgi:2-keto-4-pentenoate hydratase/2-oxohepta-3-ene-1,7-dioic acid hydratase in catechol pathway
MKFMRVGAVGQERPVLVTKDDDYLDLTFVTRDIDQGFWTRDGLSAVHHALDAGKLEQLDVRGERVGAPIARPGAILCVGLNYVAHAVESGVETPKEPVLFYKAPHTIVGPYDDIRIPRNSTKTDWEVELGVVIGKRAQYLKSAEDAAEVIAGYTISHDVSERHFQLDPEVSGGQWSKGKNCETFNPLGPWLVTADELADPQNLRLRSWVNGELRQDSSTADMVFSVADIIFKLSQYTVLEPGDLISTGTPEGVALSGRFPYLHVGDTVALEIEGLGRQESGCVAS